MNTVLDPGTRYGIAIKDMEGNYRAIFLDNIEQDANGSDLATANVHLTPEIAFNLADKDVPYGTNIFTFGYPFTNERKTTGTSIEFEIKGRYFEGYVMRTFNFDYPSYGITPSYELSIPAPAGLSGAPVLKVKTRDVMGVVYYSHEEGTIDQYVSIDPTTGEKQPEIQNIISFALAHFTDTMKKLSGKATRNLPLIIYLNSLKQKSICT